MRNIPIDKTFNTIYRLPPEIEFATIEQFVLQQPDLPAPKSSFLTKQLNKKLLFTIGIMCLVAASFFLNTHSGKQNDTSNHRHEYTVTSCFCNFGDDDAWIEAFIREMEKDKIIIDTTYLRFTITGKSFKVNGKELNESLCSKYKELFASVS